MKGALRLLSAGALAIAAVSATAGTQTAILQVTATIGAGCSSVGVTPLNFGGLTPGINSVLIPVTTQVACTTGTIWVVSWGGGNNPSNAQRYMQSPQDADGDGIQDRIGYFLYLNANGTNPLWDQQITGTGTGMNQDITLFAQATPPPNAPPGSYSDSVQVTLTF